MNLWELRQAIESAIPAWVSVVALIFAAVFLAYSFWRRGYRETNRCPSCGRRPATMPRMHGSGGDHADLCPESRPFYPEGDDD